MNHFIVFCFFFLLCYSLAEAQTNANIPGPENVLVVYRAPVDESDTLSKAIMEYYVSARGIPYPTNVVELDLPRRVINLNDGTGDHVVKLAYDNEYIQDSTWAEVDSISYVAPKFQAWLYFLEEMAEPIRLHLQNNNLTETIRYIVMCQGVPFKLQARGDHSTPANISIDGLLCMLNTNNYDNFVQAIFDQFLTQNQGGYGSAFIPNPYFNRDSNFEMNARFLPDFYGEVWNGYNYKLSYLVSRLDGLSFQIIKDIIDKSIDADTTGERTWILDGGGPGSLDIANANITLKSLGFLTEHNSDITDWITESSDDVIGYTSAGVHQGMQTA